MEDLNFEELSEVVGGRAAAPGAGASQSWQTYTSYSSGGGDMDGCDDLCDA